MSNKWIIAFALILIAMPLVSSAQTTIAPVMGLDITTPDHADSLKINTNHTWHFHVFNATSGYPIIPNKTVSCEFNLYALDAGNPTGVQVADMKPVVSTQNDIWEFTIDNMTTVGEYSYVFHCNDTSVGGVLSETFPVTRTGENTSSFDYLPVMIALLTAIAVLLFISINLGKDYGALSLVLLVLPLFLVQGMIQLANNMMQNTFSDTTFTHNLTAYQIILPILSFIILFVIFTMMIVKSAKNATAVKNGDAD